MLKVYGFSRVNKIARGNTRDLRVLWALERWAYRPRSAWIIRTTTSTAKSFERRTPSGSSR